MSDCRFFLAFAFSNVDYATMSLPQSVQTMPGNYSDGGGVFQATTYSLGIISGQGRGEVFLDYELFPVAAPVNAEVAIYRGAGYTGIINWFCPLIANESNIGQLKIDDPALYATTVANIVAYPLPDEVGIALSCYPSEFETIDRYVRNVTERAAVWATRGRPVTLFVAFRNTPVGPVGGGAMISQSDFRAMVEAAAATGVRVALWHGGEALNAVTQPYWDIFLAVAASHSAGSGQIIRVGAGITRSKFIALLNCLDPLVGTGGENYDHGAVLPALWDGGWPAFWTSVQGDRLWAELGVSRFLLMDPWGIYSTANTKTIGYSPAQAAITSQVMGPRQSESVLTDARLVVGQPGNAIPSFTDFWQGIVADFASQGGEFICHQGPPPVDTARDAMTIDNWVREAETCGMSVSLDRVAAVDRLSYPTPASILADRLNVRRRKTTIGQHQPLDPRVNGWYDGRFSALSTKAQADLAWGSPASYNVPNLGMDSTVLITKAVTASAADRVQLGLLWLGRVIRGSAWTVAVETIDMTDSQIISLSSAGG